MKRITLALIVALTAYLFVYITSKSVEAQGSYEGVNPDTVACLDMNIQECITKTAITAIVITAAFVALMVIAIAVRRHDDKHYFENTSAHIKRRPAITAHDSLDVALGLMQPILVIIDWSWRAACWLGRMSLIVLRWIKDDGIEYALLYAYIPFYCLGRFRDYLYENVHITFPHKQRM